MVYNLKIGFFFGGDLAVGLQSETAEINLSINSPQIEYAMKENYRGNKERFNNLIKEAIKPIIKEWVDCGAILDESINDNWIQEYNFGNELQTRKY